MKWITQYTEELDTEYVKCFAFLPVILDNGFTVWLESYYKKLRFETYPYDETIVNGEPNYRCQWEYSGWKSRGKSKTIDELIKPIDNFYRNLFKS